MNGCVIIPAYEPEQSFCGYVKLLLEQGQMEVIVVDDGSSPACAPVFSALERLNGCVVLRHPANRGKGAALKTAFQWYLEHLPEGCPGVVTADCDGQHRIGDVQSVQSALKSHPDTLVLGSRVFDASTPARSLGGNRAASAALAILYDIRLKDTQTGLRGIPNALLPGLCQVRGDRFEYELNMLVYAKQKCIPMLEIPICTIYFNQNQGSHFRPLVDSMRILAVLCGSLFQSMGAAALSVVIDVGVYAFLVKVLLLRMPLTWRLFWSTITARILSSTANYACNRHLPYVQNKKILPTLLRYYFLWLCQLAASFAGTWLLTGLLGVDDLAGKLLVDLLLALVSYQVQLRWVFRLDQRKGGVPWEQTSASMHKSSGRAGG